MAHKKPKIKIEAVFPGDEKLAKLFEKIIKHETDDLMPVIEAIASAKQRYILFFGESEYTTDDRPWNRIMEGVIKMKMGLIKKYSKSSLKEE